MAPSTLRPTWAGPALDWGSMHGFTVGTGTDGEPRYCAYSPDMMPLTASLSAYSFCAWTLLTQFPCMGPSDIIALIRTFYSLGLADAMGRAHAFVMRNCTVKSVRKLHVGS